MSMIMAGPNLSVDVRLLDARAAASELVPLS
jgi:hypothetical protein